MNWLCLLIGYVIGATPFGFLAGKLKGIDIREHGSGNIGATNVLRVLGKPIGLTVFACDVLKGIVPVVIALLLTEDTVFAIFTAIATILGHNFTFWLGFKGGKGIATTAGAMLPLIPIPLTVSVITWIVLFYSTRYVSVGSIFAALVIPVVALIEAAIRGKWDAAILVFSFAICFLAIWRHRSNIGRLLEGTESRFEGKSKKAAPDSGGGAVAADQTGAESGGEQEPEQSGGSPG